MKIIKNSVTTNVFAIFMVLALVVTIAAPLATAHAFGDDLGPGCCAGEWSDYGSYDDGWTDYGSYDDGWSDYGSYDDGWTDYGSYDDGWSDYGSYDDGWSDYGSYDDGWSDYGSYDDGWSDYGSYDDGWSDYGSYDDGWSDYGSYDDGWSDYGSYDDGWSDYGSYDDGYDIVDVTYPTGGGYDIVDVTYPTRGGTVYSSPSDVAYGGSTVYSSPSDYGRTTGVYGGGGYIAPIVSTLRGIATARHNNVSNVSNVRNFSSVNRVNEVNRVNQVQVSHPIPVPQPQPRPVPVPQPVPQPIVISQHNNQVAQGGSVQFAYPQIPVQPRINVANTGVTGAYDYINIGSVPYTGTEDVGYVLALIAAVLGSGVALVTFKGHTIAALGALVPAFAGAGMSASDMQDTSEEVVEDTHANDEAEDTQAEGHTSLSLETDEDGPKLTFSQR